MKKSQICNYVGIALMALLLLLQFMPFWDGVSIQSYIWFPKEYTVIDSYIASQVGGDYNINSIIWIPIIILVFTVVGIVLSLIMSDNIFVGLVPLVCGLAGVYGYLVKAPLQLGTNWSIHLAVCAILVFIAIFRTYFLYKND